MTAHLSVLPVAAAAAATVSCQVEDDRAQINAVIQQLDEKKREALKETWKQVRESITIGTAGVQRPQACRISRQQVCSISRKSARCSGDMGSAAVQHHRQACRCSNMHYWLKSGRAEVVCRNKSFCKEAFTCHAWSTC
jgi:hypothetical protein